MSNNKLDQIAEQLNQSGDYRVIRKYQKSECYNHGNEADVKSIGVFLDIETTGLTYSKDKLIELGMVKFEYTEDGRIFRLLEEFNSYQDPRIPIPEHITKLTGITDDMVKGHSINESEVISYLDNVDIIIAHNAEFDRAFFETKFPSIAAKAWACSMRDIDWKSEDISSFKLEYIAYKYGMFYDGHRAIIDCLAGIHILAQSLFNSRELALKALLDNALQIRFKLWASNAPYDYKNLLKEREYRWGTHPTLNIKAWSIEVTEDNVEAEIEYLCSSIYQSFIDIPIEIFDAYSRFSKNDNTIDSSTKYADKLQWAIGLCRKTENNNEYL